MVVVLLCGRVAVGGCVGAGNNGSPLYFGEQVVFSFTQTNGIAI